MGFLDMLKGLVSGKKEEVVGLDIGSDTIKIASAVRNANGFELTRFSVCPAPPMTVKDGTIIDAVALGEAITELLAQAGFGPNPKIVSVVSGPSVLIRPIEMPQLSERELQGAIRYQADGILPYRPEDAQINGHIIRNNVGPQGNMMEVLLVATPNEMVKNAREVIQLAHATPGAVDLEPFALLNALNQGAGVDTSGTVALINMGASSSSINIFKDGTLRQNRTISVAGNSFTKAVSQSLNLSYEEAEKTKKEKGVIRVEEDDTPIAPTSIRIFNVIKPVLKEFVVDVQRSFDYYRTKYPGEKVDNVFLAGGSAMFKNIDIFLTHELGVECKTVNPFQNVSTKNVKGITQEELEQYATMAMVVTGLALRSK